MDIAVIILVALALLWIGAHPATRVLFNYIKLKFKNRKENKLEKLKCYHTIEDCRECMSYQNCPMKHENIIRTKRDDY